MTAFTIRAPEVADRLNEIARKKLDRSRSCMAAQAIDDFVLREEWPIAEIEAGIALAECGDFASDKDVARSGKMKQRLTLPSVWSVGAGAARSLENFAMGTFISSRRKQHTKQEVGVEPL
jgi:predicted transcriptional regulator